MNLSEQDAAVVERCLRAAVEGPFFPDWEFQLLFGFERDEVRAIAEAWPHWKNEAEQADAVNATLNNVLGYPHGQAQAWRNYIGHDPSVVAKVYARWRAGELDGSPRGYVDRLA